MEGSSEKRRAERVKVCCKVDILEQRAHVRNEHQPALSVDISATGVCLNTPHVLEPGQQVEVLIDTSLAAGTLSIPHALRASARVCRVEQQPSGLRKVAMAFAPAFTESMEAAFYMAFLGGLGHGTAPALG